MSGQSPKFATLTGGLGAVAQSGSAPRSHRGGQGFKSPQLHPNPQVKTMIACVNLVVKILTVTPATSSLPTWHRAPESAARRWWLRLAHSIRCMAGLYGIEGD